MPVSPWQRAPHSRGQPPPQSPAEGSLQLGRDGAEGLRNVSGKQVRWCGARPRGIRTVTLSTWGRGARTLTAQAMHVLEKGLPLFMSVVAKHSQSFRFYSSVCDETPKILKQQGNVFLVYLVIDLLATTWVSLREIPFLPDREHGRSCT